MKILLLAGTGEANSLAARLIDAGHSVIASFAGATRAPKMPDCETRVGGFGGEDGFRNWVAQSKPDMVIDATHPFAQRITNRTARICHELGLQYLQVLRPKWTPDENKLQTEVASIAEARKLVRPAARVFLATGRQTLMQFEGFSDCYLICRQIDPPNGPFPFPNGEFLVGRPPFSVEDEKALFTDLDIDWLIVKNAGGAASYSKIEAAAELKIPVLMLRRPVQPSCDRVSSIEAALDWVDSRADH